LVVEWNEHVLEQQGIWFDSHGRQKLH
jgi:hypothetical protein